MFLNNHNTTEHTIISCVSPNPTKLPGQAYLNKISLKGEVYRNLNFNVQNLLTV